LDDRVLLVGSPPGKKLQSLLSIYGLNTEFYYLPKYPLKEIVLRNIDEYTILVVGIFGHIIQKIRYVSDPKKTIYYFVGSDAYLLNSKSKELLKRQIRKGSRIIYVSEHLKKIVGLEGAVLPIPVNTVLFHPLDIERSKDLLYYVGNGDKLYRPEWIKAYIDDHPSQKVTVIGQHNKIPYREMPILYNQHKKYVRMTTRDGSPRMVYEALLCGCEVWWNERKITEMPREMNMEYTIPKTIDFIYQ
jgi:hypothetical protein